MFRSWACRFFLLTFICSWGLWLVPVMGGLGTPLTYTFYALGGIAPSSVGIAMAYMKRDKDYWRDFRRRILSLRLIGFRWYVFIVLFVPLLNALALAAGFLTTGNGPELSTLLYYAKSPVKLALFAAYMLAFGPVVEEIGWRGFALDHLERKYSRVLSSMILGMLWAAWHIPLFFIDGTYQYGLLQESYVFLIDFLISFLPMSIIMGFLYHRNNRSILSGILFHFSINFYGELINIPNGIKPYRTLFASLFAAVILILWRQNGMSLNMDRPQIHSFNS